MAIGAYPRRWHRLIEEKRVVEIITDGIDGPAIDTDGTSEHVLVDPDDGPPPPLAADVTFEDRPGGFEIWFSERIAHDHHDLVEASIRWLEAQPGVESLLYEDPVVLMVDGRWDEDLESELRAWWSEHLDGIDVA